MVIGATGCSGGDETSGTGEASETTDTAEVTEEAEEIAKIGFVFHGDASTYSFASEMNDQRLKAAGHSNVETEYVDNISVSGFDDAVKLLVDDGCTQIVSCSSVFTNVLTSTAGKYMNIDFISYGARVRSVNIYAYTEEPFQGSYVAGMAAAYNSETEKIGIVADPDLIYTIPVVNAAALGTQLVYQDAKLVAAYATKDDEIHTAIDALIEDNCDVIICYTESGESEKYCDSKGIKFIGGRDFNENYADYENMLMYYYCSRDSFYLSQFKQITMNNWEADAYVGSMGNGVVNVSDVLPAAKDGTSDIVNALVPKVTNGSAYIFEGELKDTSGNVKYMQGSYMSLSEIYAMDWYVKGVTIVGNYRQPLYDTTSGTPTIKS
jgi:basic membrane lipoprotein Med (substrate-binding protein (PBP1-ABC) superfamily)